VGVVVAAAVAAVGVVAVEGESEGEGTCPSSLLLQWHVTERCNLRCAHCYQEGYRGEELGFPGLLDILAQFLHLLDALRAAGNPAIRGHITVTGGEPFVRRDLLDLLEAFAAHHGRFSFAVLTNGTLIDASMARRLSELGVGFVQVSVEGAQATHDRIRGAGDYARTVAAIEHLVGAGIRTLISFTAHRDNYREFADVARLGRRLRVSRVWADRLIPWGSGTDLREQVLTPDETREFLRIMRKARRGARWDPFGCAEIAMHRALQFLVGGGQPYHCTAGDTLVTVQPNGDLLPCRRMPIRVGNLMDTPLLELYGCELFRALRRRDRVSAGCEDCSHQRACRGGLKCLSYAVTGDPFQADPGCWIAAERS
jgi:radical SAM protein with 4Fe4S-binding SPASM domain